MKILPIVCALWPGLALADGCADLWQQVQAPGLGYDVSGDLTTDGDACVITGMKLGTQAEYGLDITIDRLSLTASDLAALVAMTPAANDIQLVATGIRTMPALPDPVLSYLYAAQARAQAGYSLSVDLSFDPVAGRLSLREAGVDLGALGRVSLSVDLSGIVLDLPDGPEPLLMALGLDLLRFDATSTGLFETFVLIPLGAALLTGPDPVSEVTALQDQTLALIALVPATVLDAASRTALAALVGEMPNPHGRLQVDGRAAPGFLMAFAGLRSDLPLTGLLDGVTATATYTPIPKAAP